ncbi:DJ-1/PfpI family protein [Mycolicibacterium goodii]|uniref:DJ-1/PfpI family protein n=1 Tax=Mycolicibacterium goodii TaxID=134601 RepID=UPI001BDD38AD|nr:DJ-1/PfpI family protein [Mycolicibacterium goodii]MBU8816503.1 DJ-1/PfpI family protein [Mycolicibacterium goodii]MBU8831617.1 DJ-1/PfpI family protein [Mycolicibacterium goodii]
MQVAIALYRGFTALDAVGPYEVLRQMPHTNISFISNKAGPVLADSGVLSLYATCGYDEESQPDIVIVPGSSTHTETAMRDTELIEWLQRVHQTTTWTTSVCTGAMILGASGILCGRAATTHWTMQSALTDLGADSRTNHRIVRDGKLVTAAGVSAGIDFALWLAGEICGRERAEMI